VAEYVKKGSKLYVEGRLQTRSWEQDGVKRYATEIIANEMQMLDSRGGSDGASWQGGQTQQPRSNSGGNSGGNSGSNSRTQPAPPPEMDNNFDDDIPF
jgi:single-strand DNA-binding protein